MLVYARGKIEEKIGEIDLLSSVYESQPWGFADEIYFLNQVVRVLTSLPAGELLKELLMIESSLGRKRIQGGYHSRCIDIDILFLDDLVIQTRDLIIPHPRIQERRFVLVPMAEIANDFIHPGLKCNIAELLDLCNDRSEVRLYNVKT
jgi:2-amino-4-hydroxy-6-hydroxymethyldihydropteridine diphosphokinase